ncbi:hypothetical protein [Streptomyces sp. 1331.2]|uniref:hypothetical protein n=1 Tax=Streptomyces sp. 1331.2 TaxID=1938835 RepID=UPI000BC36A72|nr:hypothetical protein [Streptomyces sp. 1331.2]SOB83150.1 hypothetical protein SAMN06272789_3348 [Streptomyces sp. 1331.2]
MTQQPTAVTYTKRPAGAPMSRTMQAQKAPAATFAEQLMTLVKDHEADRALAMLRSARELAAAGRPVEGPLVQVIFEAYLDAELSIEAIAAELDIAEQRVQAIVDGHACYAYRVDLQTADGWEVDDYAEFAPAEIVDADPVLNAEKFAQTVADEVLAGHDPDVIRVRVLVWAGRPGRDEDAAAVVERFRA